MALDDGIELWRRREALELERAPALPRTHAGLVVGLRCRGHRADFSKTQPEAALTVQAHARDDSVCPLPRPPRQRRAAGAAPTGWEGARARDADRGAAGC